LQSVEPNRSAAIEKTFVFRQLAINSHSFPPWTGMAEVVPPFRTVLQRF
jgi:hypothetical protein